ncbi:MAG: ABC transporter ATP-binding protein [Clostridia bacterium]
MNNNIIEIQDLKKYFYMKKSFLSKEPVILKAVDGVSLSIVRGKTLGLVGESGCGKTTLGRTIIRLYEPTSGRIIFNGEDVTTVPFKPFRQKMQYIFQDPYASLDPRKTISDIVGEALDIHNMVQGKKDRAERIKELLKTVGLSSEHASRYPHEFSGGQRQRIGIARSLAVEPEFLICDEPISALDVSIQAQIINMLVDMQASKNLTYLFIAHDLAVVKHISDFIGVMYLGKIIEYSASNELYSKPLHPYTKALISSIPVPDPSLSRNRNRIILQGDVPSPVNLPSGCRFRTRCPIAQTICAEQEPPLIDMGGGHLCACHFA